MRRRTQTEQFKVCFPEVDLKSVQGMMLFQGFLAGYNKAQEGHQADKNSFKTKLNTLQTEVQELNSHINRMKLLNVASWDLEGDEA